METSPPKTKLSPNAGRGRQRRPPYRFLLFSLVATTLLLIISLVCIESVDGMVLFHKLFLPLCRLLVFIFFGLILGQIIESTGWTRHLAKLAKPMFSFANLGTHCSAAFTTAFISGVASNAMLLGFYKDNMISRRQMYLSNFINQFPAYFLHLPTTFFIVVPLTGKAGVIYFALTFAATLLRVSLFLLFGHFFISPVESRAKDGNDASQKQKPKMSVMEAIRKKIPGRITTIIVWVLPIYTVVFLLNQLGSFETMNQLMSKFFVTSFVPVEALSVVILSFAAEFTSGFAAAGAMLDAGVITVQQTVIALVVGNILAFPIRALRHQLPRYIGIFSPKMGTEILMIGQACRIGSLICVTLLYFYFI